ncbi:hypothetical protein [Devosia sp. SL43]|uniref:hypothetical protein n=1 Tax=Devosia sp. SL43 TaxID=2806348 RepID=UPI001F32CE02|nr:hypothetical protein [Devosia sp. SL43]UJW84978.1 hypothetical protein IM737_16410 [Devosia sp. SL43]
MSSLIIITVAIPLGAGVLIGLLQRLTSRAMLQCLLAALLVLAIFILLEGIPPLPPVSSKHKLAIVVTLLAVIAPFTAPLGTRVLAVVSILALGVGLIWIGGNRLTSATAWPSSIWLLPLPLVLGVLTAGSGRDDTTGDGYFVLRIGVTFSAIAAAAVALLGGFVGAGQLEGALAAAFGGTLIVSFVAVLAGRGFPPPGAFRSANWLLAMAHSAIFLTVACFSPSISPLAAYLAVLPMVAVQVVSLKGMTGLLRPVVFGIVAALPAAAAVGVAYWNSVALLAD